MSLMKTIRTTHLLSVAALTCFTFTAGEIIGQGNNWKLDGNNNVGMSSSLGSRNNAPLQFKTNDVPHMTLQTNGDLNLNDNMTIGGFLVVDSIHVLNSARIGTSSLSLNFPVINAVGSTIGKIYLLRDGVPVEDIRVAIGHSDPALMLDLNGSTSSTANGGILATGTFGSPAEQLPGFGLISETRLIWFPEKAAFRAGRVAGTEWDAGNIDDYSVGFGQNTSTTGTHSAVFGEGTSAGLHSAAFGQNTTAGTGSAVFGRTITATNFSAAFGFDNDAGDYSLVFGEDNHDLGWGNLIGGTECNFDANSNASLAIGEYCGGIDAVFSTALGTGAFVGGFASFALGQELQATANNSYVLGRGFGTFDLINSTEASFMIGFNSNVPTLFVEGVLPPGSATAIGQVGIGNTDPSQRLDVNGNARLRTLPNASNEDVTLTKVVVFEDGGPDNGTLRWRDISALTSDDDWERQGQNIFTGTPGVTIPTLPTGFVSIGQQIPSIGGKFSVLTQDQTTTAGVFFSTGTFSTDWIGVYGRANGNNPISQLNRNIGVIGQAFGTGPGSNLGVWGEAAGHSAANGGRNIGIRADARNGYGNIGILAGVNPNIGGYPNNVAGFFGGDIAHTGNIIPVSDANLKQNIQDIGNASAILSGLQPRTFNYDTVGNPQMTFATGTQYGLIAQEVEQVIADIVMGAVFPSQFDSLGNQTSPDVTYKGVNYTALIPFLIKGWQEQQQTIDSMLMVMGECCNETTFKTGGGNNGGNEGGETREMNEPIQEKLVSKGVILYDAVPNPFQNEVSIAFFIPGRIITAQIMFHDNFGRTLKTVEVNQRGNGTVIIDASGLANGLYTYGIVADGQAIETKKMIRSK